MPRLALCFLAVLPLLAQRPEWVRPYDAHRVAGNVYFVGTEDLACFLITDPAGHVLINTGLVDSVALIRNGVEGMGFRFADIKILLTMQGHHDHVAGFAEIVKETGAKVYATEADAPLLENGGKGDPIYSASMAFPPVKVDRRIKDGEKITLGKTALTVHLTPGHTAGSVSYSTTLTIDGKRKNFMFANMGSVVMPLLGNTKYPGIVDDFRSSFARQKQMRPDIWVAAHGSQYGMQAKHRKGSFEDPQGYLDTVARYEQSFLQRLDLEKQAEKAGLPEGNAAGVAAGHMHLTVRDINAHKYLWVDAMGGKLEKFGALEVITFPDVVIALRKGEPTGGTDGSVVNHLGFKVRDLDKLIPRLEAEGAKVDRRMPETRQVFMMFPDGVKVEFSEFKDLPTPFAHHHVHFYSPDVMAHRAWYVERFGAVAGKRGRFETATVPGVELAFAPTETPVAPTDKRSVDHIGFEINNLEAFCKKLEASGVKFSIPYRQVPSIGLAIAFFTDPWGAKVELTEGLRRHQ